MLFVIILNGNINNVNVTVNPVTLLLLISDKFEVRVYKPVISVLIIY